MGLYWLGGEIIDTHVQHVWPIDRGPGPQQTVYWIRPGVWVVEVNDADADADVPDGRPAMVPGREEDWVWHDGYLYPLAEAAALALLARHGHGPNIWACPCDQCSCACGESFHTHPWVYLPPGALLQGSCTRLHTDALLHRLSAQYRAYLEARPGPPSPPHTGGVS